MIILVNAGIITDSNNAETNIIGKYFVKIKEYELTSASAMNIFHLVFPNRLARIAVNKLTARTENIFTRLLNSVWLKYSASFSLYRYAAEKVINIARVSSNENNWSLLIINNPHADAVKYTKYTIVFFTSAEKEISNTLSIESAANI